MATIYGLSPRMRFDLVVNLLTAKAVFDNKITIFGGSQWRPNLHVEDASEAFIKCLDAPINKIRGEIFILKMPALKTIDLAEVMIEELAPKYCYNPKNIEIKIVGSRPGEKLHEKLITEEEIRNALEMDGIFVILPHIMQFHQDYSYPNSRPATLQEYSSNKAKLLAKEEIRKTLKYSH